jgi:hypothetical protein
MSVALFIMALAALASLIPVSGAPVRRQAASNTGLHPVFSLDGGLNYCINVYDTPFGQVYIHELKSHLEPSMKFPMCPCRLTRAGKHLFSPSHVS